MAKLENEEQLQITNVDLPSKKKQSVYSGFTFEAITNTLFIIFYSITGAKIKLGSEKVKTLNNIVTVKSQSNAKETVHLNTHNTTKKGNDTTPATAISSVQYARLNYAKKLILIFTRTVEHLVGKSESTITQDYGIIIEFEVLREACSLIESKGAVSSVNSDVNTEDDI